MVADIAKLSVGREEYYTRELATDHEQYLSGHGESPGRWYGAGATSLGLQGEASVAGFQAMFEGRDPTTGELLGRGGMAEVHLGRDSRLGRAVAVADDDLLPRAGGNRGGDNRRADPKEER